MQISAINSYIVDILPGSKPMPNKVVDLLPQIDPRNISNLLMSKLTIESSLRSLLMELKNKVIETHSDLGYEKYVAVTPAVRDLALEITAGLSSDDEKMFAIEQWVQKNIKYISDIKEYGKPEYWAMPQETLNHLAGDCEDGAFLIHALGLGAGVSSDRLRTYGGLAFNPTTGTPFGHGWVAYKREGDNQWITLDWSYFPKSSDLESRRPMSTDMKYIDDFWYITQDKTVDTPIANKVRYASHLDEATKGNFTNTYI